MSQGVVNDCNDRAALGQGKRQLKSILMEWGLVGLLVKISWLKLHRTMNIRDSFGFLSGGSK